MRSRGVSFENDRKLIVCEGSSDKTFISAYCARNGIVGFQYACTAEGSYDGAGGFDVFDKYLTKPLPADAGRFPFGVKLQILKYDIVSHIA